jgi:deoxyribonucleoside regulator
MDDETYDLLATVASLYFEEGLTQDGISTRMGYSRSYISRLLNEARKEGIIEIHIHHRLERERSLEEELKKVFQLREVRVLKDPRTSYPDRLHRLGALGAALLEERITEHSVLGLSYGTALYEVSQSLHSLRYPGLKVIQLLGNIGTIEPHLDGPGLVRSFARSLGGHFYTLPAPWRLDNRMVRDALYFDSHMRQVLNLSENLDLAFVGVGTIVPEYSAMVQAGFISVEDAIHLQEESIVGDVCGLLFDIEGNLHENPAHGYVFGIKADTLRKVPLVVGVAGGQLKALTITGAIHAGLINALVTDEEAAEHVLLLNETIDTAEPSIPYPASPPAGKISNQRSSI